MIGEVIIQLIIMVNKFKAGALIKLCLDVLIEIVRQGIVFFLIISKGPRIGQ